MAGDRADSGLKFGGLDPFGRGQNPRIDHGPKSIKLLDAEEPTGRVLIGGQPHYF